LISLLITSLDWSNAFMGAITDVVILVALALSPRISSWLS
jgi:hypothetical protein